MLLTTQNIFGLSGPSRPFQNVQNSPNAESISKEIKQYLKSVGSSQYHPLSQIVTNEYIGLQSPASQNMIDVYHQSKAASFEQFTEDTSLSCLRQDNPHIFDKYQQYQLAYNNDICQPLSNYKPSENEKFTSNLSETIQQLSLAFYDCKRRKRHNKCCTQMDVMFRVPSTESADSNHNEQDQDGDDEDGDDEDSDDEDEEYDVNLRKYNQNIQQSLNFPRESSANYHNRFKYSDFVENELDTGLAHIMRMRFRGFPPEPFTYQRNEILVDNYDQYTVKTLTTEDIVPKLSFENTPLFRHYNTINGIKSMVKYLGVQAANLLVFSFHILHDCLQLFCYIYANGQIYGSRIFTKDLFEEIPRFYKYATIDNIDKLEILKNMKIADNLQFDDDKTYKEYHVVLTSRKASNDNRIETELSDELTKFVEIWDNNKNCNDPLDLNELMKIFVLNQIDDNWFKDDYNQTKFFIILLQNKYPAPFVIELWNHLTAIEYKIRIKEKENVIPLQQQHANIQQNRQIDALTSLVTVLQHKTYAQSQEIQKLKSNNIHCGALSLSSSSSGNLDEIANCNPYRPPLSMQNVDNYSTISQETMVNNQFDQPEINNNQKDLVTMNLKDLPSSPMNIETMQSFNTWDSRCDGCRMSEQSSSDEDNAEIKYAQHDDNRLPDNDTDNNIDNHDNHTLCDMHQETKEEKKDDSINTEVTPPPPSPPTSPPTLPPALPEALPPPSPEQLYSNYGKNDTLFSDRASRYYFDVTRATLRYINNQPVFLNNQWKEYMDTNRELVGAMIQGWIFQQLNNLSKQSNHKN